MNERYVLRYNLSIPRHHVFCSFGAASHCAAKLSAEGRASNIELDHDLMVPDHMAAPPASTWKTVETGIWNGLRFVWQNARENMK